MSKETRTELVEQLRKLGVETATAKYRSFKNIGEIKEPEFEGIDVPADLASAVRDLFHGILDERFQGWEQEDLGADEGAPVVHGSYGDFEWNVQEDVINFVRNFRVENRVAGCKVTQEVCL